MRWSAAFLVLVVWPTSAQAYSTRLHMAYANELREALIASGDGSIPLLLSDASVQLRPEDSAAIEAYPLAFRAGAIGPDNFVFPGLTDATHGVEQDPFRQCEHLYQDAVTEEERAYALGCFVHGTGDVIAHHLVNWFTGETFTLTPVSHSHMSSFDNVIGHITTESQIQAAVYAADPSAFDAGSMALAIPRGFASRNYHNPESPLWQLMARHVVARIEEAQTADPDADLFDITGSLGLSAWEHVMMAPRYVAELQEQRAALRAFVLAEIADMQDPLSPRGSDLLVAEGPDGMLSTADDTTACAASCPLDYATYFTYVNLLLPRMDAGGGVLPSAFDKISEKLGDDLNLLLPALMDTIERLSVVLNAPVTSMEGNDLPIAVSDVTFAMQPMRDWITNTTALDYETVARSVTPSWYQSLSDLFSGVGVDLRPANILEILFEPVVSMVQRLIEMRVVAVAEDYLGQLIEQHLATASNWETCIQTRLAASTPPGASGHAFADIKNSGFWAYTMNLMATTLANHEVVLTPIGEDPIERGPASFDASYTHVWTQAGLCDYLRPSVFPLGLEIDAFLSVNQGGMVLPPVIDTDVPVECHDGSLMEFGMPNMTTCNHTTLDDLRASWQGSLSRSFPPQAAMAGAQCRNLVVDGLPLPPEPGTDAGIPPGTDVGPDFDAGPGGGGGGGCGCRVEDAPSSLAWVGVWLLVVARRRR